MPIRHPKRVMRSRFCLCESRVQRQGPGSTYTSEGNSQEVWWRSGGVNAPGWSVFPFLLTPTSSWNFSCLILSWDPSFTDVPGACKGNHCLKAEEGRSKRKCKLVSANLLLSAPGYTTNPSHRFRCTTFISPEVSLSGR